MPLQYASENNKSLVLLLQLYHYKFLITGDIEAPTEKLLLNNNVLSKIDILQPHYGSKISSSLPFLKAIKLTIALIPGHFQKHRSFPSVTILTNLKKINAQIYYSGQNKTVVIRIYSKYLWYYIINIKYNEVKVMIHIVYGLDEYLVKKNIEHLITKTNKNITHNVSSYNLQEDMIENIINEMITFNLFAENKVIIIHDDDNLWQKYLKNEKFLSSLIHHNEKTMIIIKILIDNFKIINTNIKINIIKINDYNKKQLTTLVNKVCTAFNFTISTAALAFLLENLPPNVNIYLNELTKLRALNHKIINLAIVKDVVPIYYEDNIFKIIAFFLKKDYKNFWINLKYYHNYDKIRLINILAYQLELIKNIKILINQKKSYQFIAKHLEIPYFQIKMLEKYEISSMNINDILVKLYQLDYNIKTGKCDKNIAIELFFLSILGYNYKIF